MFDDGELLVVLASANRRGAELEGRQLAEQLSARGVPTSAVALAPGDLDVPVLGRTALAPNTLRALRRRARRARLVIAYGSSSLPASAVALAGSGIPFVYRSIGDPAAWVRGPVHRARTGLLMRRAAHVVALWPEASDSIGRLYGVKPAARSTIPNARDHRFFIPPSTKERSAARARLSVPDGGVVAALIGSLTREKRPMLAAEAVLQVPDAQLVIVGDGPARRDLEPTFAGCSRVRLLGHRSDVRPVLHAADVVVSTSVTEGMPGSLIEAALCAVPAVATDVGGASEVIGAGGIVVSANAPTIARAISDVIEQGGRLGPVARAHAVSRFSWQAVLPAWIRVLTPSP